MLSIFEVFNYFELSLIDVCLIYSVHKRSASDILHCVKLINTNMAHFKKHKSIYIVSTYEYFVEKQVLPEFSVCQVKIDRTSPICLFFCSWIESNRSNIIQSIACFRRIARFFVYLTEKGILTRKENFTSNNTLLETNTLIYKSMYIIIIHCLWK